MSREHKRPLVAFIVVSILCAVMLGHGIWRSDALVGVIGRPAPVAAAQNEQTVTVRDSAPAVAPTAVATGSHGLSAEPVVIAEPARATAKPKPTPVHRFVPTPVATVVAIPVATPIATPVVTPIATPTPAPTATPTPTPETEDTHAHPAQPATVAARKAVREAAAAAKAAEKALK